MEADGCLNAGTSVRAYYDMNDHPMGYRYVKMLEMPRDGPADASDPPVVGVSQGWIPATVVEDYDPKQNGGAGVLVKLHGFFEDPYREEKPVSGNDVESSTQLDLLEKFPSCENPAFPGRGSLEGILHKDDHLQVA